MHKVLHDGDDCHGVWLHHPDPATDFENWNTFQAAMNSYGKLTWEFTPLAQHVNFMDLTLSITETGIRTRIFEKKTEPVLIHSAAFSTCPWSHPWTCDWNNKPNLPPYNVSARLTNSAPRSIPLPMQPWLLV
jgi:hypothetical protein